MTDDPFFYIAVFIVIIFTYDIITHWWDRQVGDLVKTFTEMFWSESTLEMGFLKFVLTFVGIYIGIKAYMYLVR